MDSYALGVSEREKAVRETVSSAVNFRDLNGQIQSTGAGAAEGYQIASIIRDAIQNITVTGYFNGREIMRSLSELGVQFSASI